MLAANPYLGISEVNFDHIYLFGGSILALGVVLLLFRGMGVLRERAKSKKASWDIFYQMAKARGLNKQQSEALALVARQARVKSPARLLGTLNLFDTAVDRAVQRGLVFDSRMDILLNSARKKLATAKELWTPADGERRQVARVPCSWNARLELVSHEAIEKQLFRSGDSSDANLLATAQELIEGGHFMRHRVQISDLSAGGVALLASPKFNGSQGDIARFTGDSKRIPFSIDGICAQIQGIDNDEARGIHILHMKFLPFEKEQRKAIIQFVYEKMNSTGKKRKTKKKKAIAEPVEEARRAK